MTWLEGPEVLERARLAWADQVPLDDEFRQGKAKQAMSVGEAADQPSLRE